MMQHDATWHVWHVWDDKVLIGSDLAYDVDAMPSLAGVLAALLSPRGDQCLSSEKYRGTYTRTVSTCINMY